MTGAPHLITGSMFSGIGLLDFGLSLAGLDHAWFAERDEYRRGILARRWPGAQILDDVRAVRAGVVPRVDVLAGGFPCKGASTAGKRTGFDHPETVLWREMRRAIGELRPAYVVIENVANLLSMARAPGEPAGSAWGEVLADLAAFGFDVRWDCLPAAAFGAPHLRDRVFAVAAHPGGRGWGADVGDVRSREQDVARASDRPAADADGSGGPVVGIGATFARSAGEAVADAARERGVAVDWREYGPAIRRWEPIHGPAPEPLVRRVDDGRASRVERSRLSALGDGVLVQAGWCVGRWIAAHAAGELDLEAAA